MAKVVDYITLTMLSGSVARDLDLTPSAFANWVKQARADRTRGKSGGLTSAERVELSELRKENRQLRMERDILKKCSCTFSAPAKG
jgi:transposase